MTGYPAAPPSGPSQNLHALTPKYGNNPAHATQPERALGLSITELKRFVYRAAYISIQRFPTEDCTEIGGPLLDTMASVFRQLRVTENSEVRQCALVSCAS